MAAFLAKVAVVTVVAVAAAALAVAGLASNAQSAKNVRDGARDMLDGSRQKVYDDVVDDWNEKDGFWQRPDANERLSGKVFARSAAGGAAWRTRPRRPVWWWRPRWGPTGSPSPRRP